MLIVDLIGWMKSFEKLRKRASSPDLLFPGHDFLLSQNYPQVAQDVTRLVQAWLVRQRIGSFLRPLSSLAQAGSDARICKSPEDI